MLHHVAHGAEVLSQDDALLTWGDVVQDGVELLRGVRTILLDAASSSCSFHTSGAEVFELLKVESAIVIGVRVGPHLVVDLHLLSGKLGVVLELFVLGLALSSLLRGGSGMPVVESDLSLGLQAGDDFFRNV